MAQGIWAVSGFGRSGTESVAPRASSLDCQPATAQVAAGSARGGWRHRLGLVSSPSSISHIKPCLLNSTNFNYLPTHLLRPLLGNPILSSRGCIPPLPSPSVRYWPSGLGWQPTLCQLIPMTLWVAGMTSTIPRAQLLQLPIWMACRRPTSCCNRPSCALACRGLLSVSGVHVWWP